MPAGNELLFQLISRLGLELPPNEGQNPIAQMLRTDPYTPGDEPYLRQFMGIPKDGGLIPTDLRPKSLTVKDNLPWYRPAAYPYPDVPLKFSPDVNDINFNYHRNTEPIDNLKPGEILGFPNYRAQPGLGHFKSSISKSQSGEPFLSVYDKWDFESPVVHPLVQKMLDKVGKGFHVYERYPLRKGPSGYEVAKDIELTSGK